MIDSDEGATDPTVPGGFADKPEASSPPAKQASLGMQRPINPLISSGGEASGSPISGDDETTGPTVSEDEQTEKKHHCDCCGRGRRYDVDKLDYIFTLLRTWRWSFAGLLDIFFKHRKEHKYRQQWSGFESYIRDPQSAAYSVLSDVERQTFFDTHFGWDWVAKQLRQELEQVSDLAVFGNFDVENRMENIRLLENATSDIENAAPHLGKVLRLLDHPFWAKGNAEEVRLQSRHLLMLSIMCTSLHRKKCTNLPTSFGIYLFDGGATKRVINTYNHLGICTSYSQLRKMYLEIAKQAEKEVRELDSGPTKLILSYDNFEYQDSKAEERIESATKFMSITTAVACVPCRLGQGKSINQHLTIKQSMIKDDVYFSFKNFKNRGLSPNQLQQVCQIY